MIEEKKEEPEPLILDKTDIKKLLSNSGVAPEKLENLEKQMDEVPPVPFMASNIANIRKFEVKTPDVVVQVNPSRADLVETRIIDGRQCIVIEINDGRRSQRHPGPLPQLQVKTYLRKNTYENTEDIF